MGSAKRVATIARGELLRARGALDRRTAVLTGVMLLGLALVTPTFLGNGLGLDHGMYRVASTPDAVLLHAARSDARFAVHLSGDPAGEVDAGLADLGLEGGRVAASDSDKGHAALAALEQAARDDAVAQYGQEPDQAAAFPVRVHVDYVPTARPIDVPALTPGTGAPRPAPSAPTAPPSVSPGSTAPASPASSFGGGILPTERTDGTPEALAPPFPFRSLLLAYLFLIPMNFVAQMYAGSVIGERLQRRGEPMLASPARPWEIIAGKTLPFMALMMMVSGALALSIGAGWLTLLALAPVALCFLAMSFVAALFARSFRELTFLTVFVSILLVVYTFLPAIFAQVHPVALVSPITLVVMDLRGTVPTPFQALYALLPLTLVAVAMFVLGGALLREEDLFHQKPVPAKLLDALARQVRGLSSAAKLAVLLIPCVLVAELLLVSFVALWPVAIAFPAALILVALVEELFKGVPSYAAVARGAVSKRRAVAFGALAGLGFFAAEKGFLLASLVGLFDLPAGTAVFGPLPAGGIAGLPLLLLLAPLALHVVTASLTAWGATFGRGVFAGAFVCAVALHTTYNAVVTTLAAGVAH